MISARTALGALARALAPPTGDAPAFCDLGLAEPDPRDLAIEHAGLFGRVGPGVVSPYEGAHAGTGLREVLDAYSRGGFAPGPAFRDRPDHVCVELAFLAALAGDEEDARRRGETQAAGLAGDRARGFLLTHVRAWVPGLFTAIAAADGFPIHRALCGPAAILLAREDACAGAPPRPAAAPSRAAPPTHPVEPDALCATCGRALGFPLPDSPRASRGVVCLPCSLGTHVRRRLR